MPNIDPVLPSSEPDPVLLKQLASVKRACLAIVASLALISLAGVAHPRAGPDHAQRLATHESRIGARSDPLRTKPPDL